jgi:hypothetical protein
MRESVLAFQFHPGTKGICHHAWIKSVLKSRDKFGQDNGNIGCVFDRIRVARKKKVRSAPVPERRRRDFQARSRGNRVLL